MATNNLYQVAKNVKSILVNGGIVLNPSNGKTPFGSSSTKGLQGLAEMALLNVSGLSTVEGMVWTLASCDKAIETRMSHQVKAINQGQFVWGLDSASLLDKTRQKFQYLAGLQGAYVAQLDRFFVAQNGLASLPVLKAVQKELAKLYTDEIAPTCKGLASVCKVSTQCLTLDECKRHLYDSKGQAKKAQKVTKEMDMAWAEREQVTA